MVYGGFGKAICAAVACCGSLQNQFYGQLAALVERRRAGGGATTLAIGWEPVAAAKTPTNSPVTHPAERWRAAVRWGAHPQTVNMRTATPSA